MHDGGQTSCTKGSERGCHGCSAPSQHQHSWPTPQVCCQTTQPGGKPKGTWQSDGAESHAAWPGWPLSKFAFVVYTVENTHNVTRQHNCRHMRQMALTLRCIQANVLGILRCLLPPWAQHTCGHFWNTMYMLMPSSLARAPQPQQQQTPQMLYRAAQARRLSESKRTLSFPSGAFADVSQRKSLDILLLGCAAPAGVNAVGVPHRVLEPRQLCPGGC